MAILGSPGILQYFDVSGDPLNGGFLYTYSPGTETNKATYTTSGESVQHANPIVLNSRGETANGAGTATPVWFSGTYDLVLKDSSGTTIWTLDNYNPTTLDLTTGIQDSNGNEIITFTVVSNAVNNLNISNASTGNGPILSAVGDDTNVGITLKGKGTGPTTIGSSTSNIALTATSGTTTIGGGTGAITIGGGTSQTVTIGDADSGSVVIDSGSGTNKIQTNDSRTNTVTNALTVESQTSGTPAANIGTGILFNAESADEAPSNFGSLNFTATDVTAGSEDTKLVIQTRTAGAALASAYELQKTNTGKYVLTGAPTATRTITFPDSDLTLSTVTSGLVFISTQVASSSATIDFTGLSSTYRDYIVILSRVTPATDNDLLDILTSTNNGSSYDNGAGAYLYAYSVDTSTPGIGNAGSGGAIVMRTCNSVDNTASTGVSGWIRIHDPSTAQRCMVTWDLTGLDNSTTIWNHITGGGMRNAVADVDAVRFQFAGGNIASGRFSLYGVIAS